MFQNKYLKEVLIPMNSGYSKLFNFDIRFIVWTKPITEVDLPKKNSNQVIQWKKSSFTYEKEKLRCGLCLGEKIIQKN
ncbi:hypothetical protein BpHYR1_002942 [Brachionus plicatilis]|uniref:Uncharacterized protein n=1 Tax=Brachionus plicatilis TaxID=10195 RepID=A0A3M7T4L6_BRAPC|nr:hypothetical protein BpHYR1_002942 [Brachionus plicatilis]